MKGPMPEVRTQNIGDAEIEYLYYDGNGPYIIFLHATGFLPWIWHPIARELAGKCRVISPYFCDHRIIDPEHGGISWMQLADDLCALCRSLGTSEPFVVGHSMGATTMTLAEAVHGSVARRMILIEPIFLPEDFYRVQITVDQHPLASKSIKRKNYWENGSDAKEYLRSRKLFSNWDDEMLDIYTRYGMISGETGGLTLACHPRREAALFMGGMQVNPWPMLEKVTCPALVVEGGESENRNYIDLRKASEMLPSGEFTVVEGAGHLVPMEKPAEVLNMISSYFDI